MTEAQATMQQIVAEKTARENAVLEQAAEALRIHDKITQALRASEMQIRALCSQYDEASGATGFAVHHLRNACIARGLL